MSFDLFFYTPYLMVFQYPVSRFMVWVIESALLSIICPIAFDFGRFIRRKIDGV